MLAAMPLPVFWTGSGAALCCPLPDVVERLFLSAWPTFSDLTFADASHRDASGDMKTFWQRCLCRFLGPALALRCAVRCWTSSSVFFYRLGRLCRTLIFADASHRDASGDIKTCWRRCLCRAALCCLLLDVVERLFLSAWPTLSDFDICGCISSRCIW